MKNRILNNRFIRNGISKFSNNKIVKKIVREEDGLEIVEWAILLIIVAALIGVALAIGNSLTNGAEQAKDQIENAINGGNGGGDVGGNAGDIPTE